MLMLPTAPNAAWSCSADTIAPFNRCCLSCEFNCSYVDVIFSHNMQYFLLSCRGEHSSSRRARAFGLWSSAFSPCEGPQIPSVAIYSTKSRHSETVLLLAPPHSSSHQPLTHLSVWLQRCLTWRRTSGSVTPTATCRCPKWRTRSSS